MTQATTNKTCQHCRWLFGDYCRVKSETTGLDNSCPGFEANTLPPFEQQTQELFKRLREAANQPDL